MKSPNPKGLLLLFLFAAVLLVFKPEVFNVPSADGQVLGLAVATFVGLVVFLKVAF